MRILIVPDFFKGSTEGRCGRCAGSRSGWRWTISGLSQRPDNR